MSMPFPSCSSSSLSSSDDGFSSFSTMPDATRWAPASDYCCVTHQHPGLERGIGSEIFALGGCLYEMASGQEPFEELLPHNKREIERRYARGILPDVRGLGSLGTLAKRCWTGEFNDVDQVVAEIRRFIWLKSVTAS